MLNHGGVSFADSLISSGKVDKTAPWSFDASDENAILGDNPQAADWARYGDYHLKRNNENPPDVKAGWSYPFAKKSGDGATLYRSGLIAVRQRAGQQGDTDVFEAAGRLLEKIDGSKSQNLDLPLIGREVEVRVVEKSPNMAEMVFSTGAQVSRFDPFTGPYIEELSLDPGSMRDARLKSGVVPFMKNHGSSEGYTIEDQLGRVTGYRMENGVAVAQVEFSSRPEIQGLIQDIKNKIIRNVSVGYRVYSMEKVGMKNDVPILRVMDWEPVEISSVAIPADAGAGFRSDGAKFQCRVMGLETKIEGQTETGVLESAKKVLDNASTLIQDSNTRGHIEMENTISKEQMEKAVKDGIEAEAKRTSEILSSAQKANLDVDFARDLIDRKVSLEEARGLIIDKLSEKRAVVIDGKNPSVTITRDAVDTFREGALESLMARHDSVKNKVTEKSRDYVGLTLKELARAALEVRGISTRGMSANEIAKRSFHSTSDFANILADAAGKTLRSAYDEAPASYLPLVREIETADFKSMKRNQFGDFPAPELKLQGGEIKKGTISDAKEVYSLATYAKGFNITREAIINDDLSAFTRLPAMAGIACRQLLADKVWDIFNSNPNMGDGFALFSSQHSNLGTSSTAISVGLSSMRQKMKQQKSLDGKYMNLRGKYLIVPAERESEAEQVVSSLVVPQVVADANVYARTLSIIAEARLSAAPYYLASSLDQAIDMIEIAYLQGARGPQLNQEMKFGVGMELEVLMDFGVKAIDWRGLVKNAGV